MKTAEGKLTPDDILSASQVATVMGRNPYQTANDVLKRAFEATEGIPRLELTHEALHWGSTFEVPILNTAATRLGLGNPKTTFSKAFFHDIYPYACSLDATVDGMGRVVEVDTNNNIFPMNADKITLDGVGILEAKLTSHEVETELPDYRGKLQLQAQMDIMNASWGAVCVLYRGIYLRVFVYKRDEEIIQQIRDAAVDFNRRVEKFKTSQETEWYDFTSTKSAAEVFDQDSGEAVDINDMEDKVQTILQIKEDIKDLEGQLDLYQSQVMAKMRDAKYGNAGKYFVTWSTISYKAVPEKVVPAKPARIIRSTSLRIKENA